MSNQIVNVNSGLGLAVLDDSMDQGAEIVQWKMADAHNPKNMLWKFVGSGNSFQIVNVNSGLGLAVLDDSIDQGKEIVQWKMADAHNPKNMLWVVQPTGPSIGSEYFQIVNVNSGLGLAVNGDSMDQGAEIVQWPLANAHNPNNLQWKFNVTFSVQVGQGAFSFKGTGFVPGSTVKVTSSFAAYGNPVSGGPYTYTVDTNGDFGDTISVDYFEVAGTLGVEAVDVNQPACYSLSWGGPAGG
jgi:hypothetical protein